MKDNTGDGDVHGHGDSYGPNDDGRGDSAAEDFCDRDLFYDTVVVAEGVIGAVIVIAVVTVDEEHGIVFLLLFLLLHLQY